MAAPEAPAALAPGAGSSFISLWCEKLHHFWRLVQDNFRGREQRAFSSSIVTHWVLGDQVMNPHVHLELQFETLRLQ